MKKIVSILGARPQFIKAAAVSHALSKSPVLAEEIIHTGQHFDTAMSEVFFRQMNIPEPTVNLGISGGSHAGMTVRMLVGIEKELVERKPDCVLVYGDTNSTLAGALAGAKLGLPIAHVEAGLRSFNRAMPEEINRIVVDKISVFLFCPSQASADNLRAEGIGVPPPDSTSCPNGADFLQEVVVTGDVMVDAIRMFREKALMKTELLKRLGIESGTYILSTIHRQENTDNAVNLASIITAFGILAGPKKPVVLPLHPRTRLAMDRNGMVFPEGVRVIEPVSYLDMLMLMEHAECIITDSGGIQKEAVTLGKPCVTMRSETEWTETVESGWNKLAGAMAEKIIEAYHAVLAATAHEKAPMNLYGDGHASERIIQVLEKKFG
jgi:UDP-GlcNAc3NAcA epimerase